MYRVVVYASRFIAITWSETPENSRGSKTQSCVTRRNLVGVFSFWIAQSRVFAVPSARRSLVYAPVPVFWYEIEACGYYVCICALFGVL